MSICFSHTVKYPFIHRLGLQAHLQMKDEVLEKASLIHRLMFMGFGVSCNLHGVKWMSKCQSHWACNNQQGNVISPYICAQILFLSCWVFTWNTPSYKFQERHDSQNYITCEEHVWGVIKIKPELMMQIDSRENYKINRQCWLIYDWQLIHDWQLHECMYSIKSTL